MMDVLDAFDAEDEKSLKVTVVALLRATIEQANVLGLVGQETEDTLGLLRVMGESYLDPDPPG